MVELKSEATIEADPLAVAALIREADLSTLAGALRAWAPVALSPFHQWVYYVSALPAPLADRAFEVRQLFGVASDDAAAAAPSIWILGEDLGNVERARAPEEARGRRPALPARHEARQGPRRRTARSRSPRGGWHTELAAGSTWTSKPSLPGALSTRVLTRQLRSDHAALRGGAAAFEGSDAAARVAATAEPAAVSEAPASASGALTPHACREEVHPGLSYAISCTAARSATPPSGGSCRPRRGG